MGTYDDLIYQLLAPAPSLDKYGNEEPHDLGYQKDAANFMQDVQDLLGLPSGGSLDGSGVDPAGFDQIVTGQKEYQLPINELQPYLDLAPTSFEGSMAQAIAQGASPEEAAMAWIELSGEAGNQLSPDQESTARELANDLFQKRNSYNAGMASVPGIQKVGPMQWEHDGEGRLMGDKLVVDEYGDSTLTQQYKEAGLPIPTERWSNDDLTGGAHSASRDAFDEGKAQMDALRARVSATDSDISGYQDKIASNGVSLEALLGSGQRQLDQQARAGMAEAGRGDARPIDGLAGLPLDRENPQYNFQGQTPDELAGVRELAVRGRAQGGDAGEMAALLKLPQLNTDGLNPQQAALRSANQQGTERAQHLLGASQRERTALSSDQAANNKAVGSALKAKIISGAAAGTAQRQASWRGDTPYKRALLQKARSLGL